MAKTGFVEWMDDLPWLLKIIFAIPVLDIVWAVYRIIKGVEKNNILLIIIGILWIVPGSVFGWVIDIVSTLLFKHPILA